MGFGYLFLDEKVILLLYQKRGLVRNSTIMWFNKKPILALAPLAGYTDQPFCCVCREVSGENFVIFREMVSAEAIVRGNKRTFQMCEFLALERPIVLQIFGVNSSAMARAAKILAEKFKPDGLDINMGCSVPKVVRQGAGAGLLKNIRLAQEIVRSVKGANLGIPISVKTRLGWTKDEEILKFAPMLEKAGADLISIHARTARQGFSGQANWERIAKVKKILKIPVVANGDIVSPETAKECLKTTNANGLMIGRAAIGNPWIFSLISGKNFAPNLKEKARVILRHAELHEKFYGNLINFRPHLLAYFKGEPGARKKREKFVKITTLAELEKIL